MENQINIGDQNNQQPTVQQKAALKFRLSRKTLWLLSGGILAILFVIIGLFWNKQRYTNRIKNLTPTTVPSPTPMVSSDRLEWLVFKDKNVEYKYPKSWIQGNEVPERFQMLIKFSGSCKALIFQNQNNQNIILVVENYPQPLQKYAPSCWSQGTLSGSTPNSRQIRIGEKEDKIDIMQLSSGSSRYILERYGFESDYTNTNAYMLSVIFPQNYTGEVEPIFDEIVTSFRYLKSYRVSETKEWKTYTSKLGFSFEYPSDWGDVTEKINDAKTEGTGDSGKTYSLSFSIKSNVSFNYDAYGAGQSSDYSAGRGSIFTDYRGDPNKAASITSEITMGLTYRCYQYPVQYYPYRGVIRFNLPRKEINGVMLVVPILSPTDMGKYDKIASDFISQEESCKNPSGTESPTVIAKEKEIVDMLNKGLNFDEESQINLKVFKRISDSAMIL